MANNNVPTSKKFSKTLVADIIGWGLIAVVAFAGAGFYFGYLYRASEQAKTKAAVQDALKAIQTPQTVAEASKN